MVIFTISSYKDSRACQSDGLVLSFNIQDVILLANYISAMEPSTITHSEKIGVEAEKLVKNADLGVEEVEEEI
jgi:hypothetical protein